MNGPTKFRRTARNILDQFYVDHQLDPETAIKNLKMRLKNERGITQRYVWGMIETRYPGIV